MRARINKKCYRCDNPAVGVEHAPAKCFFPKGYRDKLITVPSCAVHNNHTAKDDEYARNIIVTTAGTNKLAVKHWRGDVKSSFLHSPKLFLMTFNERKDNSYFHDRERIDGVMIKIAYALYFHIYGTTWASYPAPFYKQMTYEDGTTDIEERFSNYLSPPDGPPFIGENPLVFRYRCIEGIFNGIPDCLFEMIFYEGFEVVIMPLKNRESDPTVILKPKN